MFFGMNRAYPIIPTPVVPPLYQPHNSASSGSNRSSTPHPETNPPQTTRKRHKSSLTFLNHTTQKLPIYSQQHEKPPSILKNKEKYSSSKGERGVSDIHAGTHNNDMNRMYDETDGYETGNVSRSQYEFYEGKESVEDEFQPNIPGTVIENCSHSTQIFVKVRNIIISFINSKCLREWF